MPPSLPRVAGAVLAAGALAVVVPAVAGAATISVSGNLVTYQAAPGETNNVKVSVPAAGKLRFVDSVAVTPGAGCVQGPSILSADCASTVWVNLVLGDMNDAARVMPTVKSRVDEYGEGGNDVLRGGPVGEVLVGGPGDDRLDGGQGSDDLYGGAGQDAADYSTRTADLTVTVDGNADDGESGEDDNVKTDVEAVWGGSGADTITGSAADNVLKGNAGNDTLYGGAGRDKLQGGADNDFLDGGAGSDDFDGGSGVDRVDYEADHAVGVNVSLNGKPDDGAPGEADLVRGSVEDIGGTDYADVLTGNGTGNYFHGYAGNDVMKGLGATDFFDDGPGDDVMTGGPGDDVFYHFDSGNDTVNYDDHGAGVTVSLAAAAGAHGTGGSTGESDEIAYGIQNIDGSSHDDVLTGNDDANSIRAFAGNDQVSGLGGDDNLDGGAGLDTLSGGPGDDHLFSMDGQADTDNCGDGSDSAEFDDGLDTLTSCEITG